LLVIGIMTGNSLDGVDAVLSKFSADGNISDIAGHSVKNSETLTDALRALRDIVQDSGGNTAAAEKKVNIQKIHTEYLASILDCIQALVTKAKKSLSDVDLIGFPGQTCAHFPKSLAGEKGIASTYTVQFGDGQELSDMTGVPVVCDFRSDDLMAGGEGAPLAPVHHEHLAKQVRKYIPMAFCNAGNTGNISLISIDKNSGKEITLGWDSGPFNHFPDLLMRMEKNESCDFDGKLGLAGKVVPELIKAQFEKSALMKNGENYFFKKAPKSSDPGWYDFIPELQNKSMVFNDRLRSAEYFSVYILFHSLSLIPRNIKLPGHLALCGGGWKNPVTKLHLEALIRGDHQISPVLDEHKLLFSELLSNHTFEANSSSFYGFDGDLMEARVFADAAVCRIKGEPFSRPDITGAEKSCVLGLLKFPDKDSSKTSEMLKNWIKNFKTNLTGSSEPTPTKWSRASAGWRK
jgi:anhydro-N-acetylmuramic acid kinase